MGKFNHVPRKQVNKLKVKKKPKKKIKKNFKKLDLSSIDIYPTINNEVDLKTV